ncbi:MAG TPA: sensor domain-containing diguanylate cyclase [Thermoanaerobaculia bacterium]|nr:sensor domain-containing diguanylate cyclase [Thermoanaerobaculia bacterium]
MPRPSLFRAYAIATTLIALAVLVTTAIVRPATFAEAAVFAALVALAALLRVQTEETSIGFESAVALAVIPLLHDPAVALVAVFAGVAAADRFRLRALSDAAELALSYYVVALLYTSAVAATAPMMAKVSGYILLLVGYLLVHLGFTAAKLYLQDNAEAIDVRRILVAEARVLLVVTPIVAVEVMAYQAFGLAGFAIAFLPVLIVAYALRNETDAGRRNAELLRRNRELSVLTESATRLLSAEGDQETLRRMVALLGQLAKLKACAIVTWEANPDVPGTVYRFGDCLPTDQDILRWVDERGLAQSAPSRAFVFQHEMRRFPLSSNRAIQVLIGIQTVEVIYGVLIYESEDAGILKSGSLDFLTLVVNQTALSLQDQLLRREMGEKTSLLEAQAATTSTILETANSLIGSFDVDAMLTRIAQAIRSALGFDVVSFALYDAKHDAFERRAHAGLDEVWEEMRKKRVESSEITPFFNQEFRVSNSFFVSHTALRQSEGGVFVRPDDAAHRPDEWHENDMLLVPLMSADHMNGYLSVRDPHDKRIPTIEKVQTLEIFAAQAVTALQSARQYEEIRRLTFIDGLTPAYNHRYFQEALSKEVNRHARSGHDFALAILDIDNFKRVNDTFGHPVGDEILKGLVDELMTNARESDVVARYGGEEFAIIFPDTPLASAKDAANRMRELVERREFPMVAIGRTLRVTISVGVAVYPHDGATSTDLISRADAALYFAKKNGKNQVAMAAELADEHAAQA